MLAPRLGPEEWHVATFALSVKGDVVDPAIADDRGRGNRSAKRAVYDLASCYCIGRHGSIGLIAAISRNCRKSRLICHRSNEHDLRNKRSTACWVSPISRDTLQQHDRCGFRSPRETG